MVHFSTWSVVIPVDSHTKPAPGTGARRSLQACPEQGIQPPELFPFPHPHWEELLSLQPQILGLDPGNSSSTGQPQVSPELWVIFRHLLIPACFSRPQNPYFLRGWLLGLM